MLLTSVPVERQLEMASKTDTELRKEIAYLTKLIDSHKKYSVDESQVNSKPAAATTEGSRFKWTSPAKGRPVSGRSAPVVSGQTASVSPHTTAAPSQGSTTTGSRDRTSQQQPSCASQYHYGNHHRRGNLSARHPGNRKWSNMVYTPAGEAGQNNKSSKLENIVLSSVASQIVSNCSSGVSVGSKSVVGDRAKQPSLPASSPSSSCLRPSTASIMTNSKSTHTAHTTRQRRGYTPSTSNSATNTKITPATHTTTGHSRAPSTYKWSQKSPSTVESPTAHPLAPKAPTLSTTSPKTVAQSRVSSARNASRYRWRRRSTPSSLSTRRSLGLGGRSSGVKSPTATVAAGLKTRPSWVVHNRYKLTRASIIHKYSKIIQRQRSNSTTKLSRSVVRRTPSQSSLKKLRWKNRVWRASDVSTGPAAKGSVVSEVAPSRRLSGHEVKSRQGNRLWIARRTKRASTSSSSSTTPSSGGFSSGGKRAGGGAPVRRISGHELKTRQGNRQWVARRVAARKTLQSPAANRPRRNLGVYGVVNQRRKRLSSVQLVSLSGQKFVVDSNGRRMKRLSLSSTGTSSSLRVRVRARGRSVSEAHVSATSVKQYLASRAVQRSRVYVWSAKQKKKDAKQYCIFYNRFGKCNRGDACQYVHDPTKIAICTKFLRGMCDKTDGSCLFSHTLSKDKMPTCLYFLRGVCTREVCPYRHVSVGRHAKICMDFARGYCPIGEQCVKRHIVDCPEYSEKGKCPRGDKCLLRHRKKAEVSTVTRQQQPLAPPPTKTPLGFRRLCRTRRRPEPENVDFGIRPAENGGSGDESCDRSRDRRLSPLDPNCPAPDFLSL